MVLVKKFFNLDNYVYYNEFDDVIYNYKLDINVNLKKYIIFDKNNMFKYIVFGVLKFNNSLKDVYGSNIEVVNYDIFYVCVGFDDLNIEFFEDDVNFSDEGSNLVGRIKWKYIYEVFRDERFNLIVKNFVEKFNVKIV